MERFKEIKKEQPRIASQLEKLVNAIASHTNNLSDEDEIKLSYSLMELRLNLQ